jgi:uncharacterized protein
MLPPERQRIAVIGSGIAGLTCAHVLGPHHDVVMFEADHRLGGHANTVEVEDPTAGTVSVDTGFIVHNDRNYPNFVRLLAELGVPTSDTEMSFAVTDRDPASPTVGFTYRATNPNTLFADRRNVTKPAMWHMLWDIRRFYRDARRFLANPDPELSLAGFLDERTYSRAFLELHLIPMGAAVWSADPSSFDQYPAYTLLTFLRNHGLLGIKDRPQWRTVVGGSRTYVDAIEARFAGRLRLGTPVTSVARFVGEAGTSSVGVRTGVGYEIFDRVVMAVHSDQALDMLADATVAEKEVLSSIRYQSNRATLHTDQTLLPDRRGAWAAWNYDRRRANASSATLTYDMTALQHLPGDRRYLVSLNSDAHIDPCSVISSFDYAHPVFDAPAIAAQQRFDEIDGVGGVHFCGAWWGYGFHEDGIASGLRVCERIGVEWSGAAG